MTGLGDTDNARSNGGTSGGFATFFVRWDEERGERGEGGTCGRLNEEYGSCHMAAEAYVVGLGRVGEVAGGWFQWRVFSHAG